MLVFGGALSAGSLAIGVVQSSGEFRLDRSLVPGNATLFDGSVVETSRASSEIALTGGFSMTLTPESRATIYRARTVLNQGTLLMRNARTANAPRQTVSAGTLRISSRANPGKLQISLSQPGRVVVAAGIGTAEVRTASGLLVARVPPGAAMDFSPQSDTADNSIKLTGCLAFAGGIYSLTDPTSRVIIELRGQNLGRYLNTRVEVVGAIIPGVTPGGGADHAVMASKVNSLGPCSDTPGTPPAGRGGPGHSAPTSAGAGGSAGLSGVAVASIVAGVAVAAAVGGLAAAGTFNGALPVSPK
jgi:hypothetical protein